MISKELIKQINHITEFLSIVPLKFINYPKETWNKITRISNHDHWIWYMLSSDSTYSHIYEEILDKWDYNFVMPDWWIIQFWYEISSWLITSHRLAYYPKVQENQYGEWEMEEFEQDYYKNDLIVESSYKNKIVVPVRFDFSDSDNEFKEYHHSYTHMTIWWFKNCRITVNKPLTPYEFISFIMKSFYNCLFCEYNMINIFKSSYKISTNPTITLDEMKYIYLNFN